ncbi:ChbG/HpnK family deacetylase [Mucilaginibacter sabulilitoris]|uniref:ChbG/HpnK family deacetylase n=1 Tax=Mucilaginibacter sabulilitoris TaxID=1173583 RepID=A0ABZ0TS07_9SPHI|nr:ChbG/HpnK family deacetylase [Mucilaginibacter sabulilitoris]WPU95694.1 ChbG/HpnK family deacetylase [Mucilaginibacter sabulilitoris]
MIPLNVIANADDFGFNSSVNKAILYCFEERLINSTSLMVNCEGFEEAIQLTLRHESIINVGLHTNLAEGKPLTNFSNKTFLTENGEWNIDQTGKKIKFLDSQTRASFHREIEAQINRALEAGIRLTHLDAHLHLHTLPGFSAIFLALARQYQLKLRLAQSFNEGNFFKFFFRRFLNKKIIAAGCNYADKFQTIDFYIANHQLQPQDQRVEIMLHPDFLSGDQLTDHYHPSDITNWISFLQGRK